VNICTGLTVNKLDESDVMVYPNPAKDAVTLEINNTSGKTNYTVCNVIGKTVVSSSVENQNKININLAGQPAGVYFIKIENNGQRAVKKIIVE
jgi:hypothetical protein